VIPTLNVPVSNGIEGLVHYANRGLPLCVGLDDASSIRLGGECGIEVLDLVLIHSGADPSMSDRRRIEYLLEKGGARYSDDSPEGRLASNLKQAKRAALCGDLKTIIRPKRAMEALHAPVDYVDFRDWADRVHLQVVGPWPSRAQVAGLCRGYSLPFARPTRFLCRCGRLSYWREAARQRGRPMTAEKAARLAVRLFKVSRRQAAELARATRPDDQPPGRPRKGVRRA
jgi:hypothetical protein